MMDQLLVRRIVYYNTYYNCYVFIGRTNDYNPEPRDVEIPAGKTRVTFNVSVNNDDTFEGNENFTLTVNVSLPTGIMVGEPELTTVIIVDDDCECLLLSL